jgi:hypothetical protein
MVSPPLYTLTMKVADVPAYAPGYKRKSTHCYRLGSDYADDVQRKLLARSDRVKSVDFHPTEPHVICGL